MNIQARRRFVAIVTGVFGVAVPALIACGGRAEDGAARPAPAAAPLRADVVLAWNELVLATAEAEDRFLTLKGLRTATMMHLAIHDALNMMESRYATYLPTEGEGEGGGPDPVADADPMAAAARAAFRVAVDQYPDQRSRFEAELARWLEPIAGGPARTRGIEIGRAAAERILAEREGDGWDAEVEYEWRPMGPGVYDGFPGHSGTPEGFVFGTGWAIARPFALDGPTSSCRPLRPTSTATPTRRRTTKSRPSVGSRAPSGPPTSRTWQCGGRSSSRARTAGSLVSSPPRTGSTCGKPRGCSPCSR
ncbi:MAG: hypothetical protein ACRELC_03830 [Gemmatimonadota bacterium]